MPGLAPFAALILPTLRTLLHYTRRFRPSRSRPLRRRLFGRLQVTAAVLVSFGAALALSGSTVVVPGTTKVGSSTMGTSVTIATSGGTVGSILVLTGGIANQDFTLNSGNGCSPGTVLNNGVSCTLTVDFTPRYPGQRFGAVILLDSAGVEMGSSDLLATGKGPLALFSPGQIQTVAGDDFWFYLGDNVPATSASIYLPYGIAVDGAQNLFVADSGNNRIRRVDAGSGIITTVVGTGSPGFFGDNGPATAAKITEPRSIAVNGRGDLYIVDTGNHVIRRVDAITHAIVTVAGMGGVQGGLSGNNGQATSATLNTPTGIALDGVGHLYIVDSGNNAIRAVDLGSGIITQFAGDGTPGFSGDGGAASSSQLRGPSGVTVAPNGDVYIADLFNNCVRLVHGGVITTIAGDGTSASAFSGDGGPAVSAKLKAPASLSFDPAGNLYISDSGNNRIRKINVATSVIQTVAGSDAESFTGDGGDATSAGLDGPYAMVVDGEGNLLITDVFHNRVRRVSSENQRLGYAPIRVNRVSPPQTRTIENDGNDALTFSAFAAIANAQVDVASTTCSLTSALDTALQCSVGADFAPTVVGDPVLGTINLVSNSPNAPQVLTLSGQVLTLDPSKVVLTSNQNPSAAGASVTFAATVSGASPTPTGAVMFYDGTAPLGSGSLDGFGVATLPTSTLTLGSHNITAVFGGDTNHAPSTSDVLVEQIKNGTTVALIVDNATITYGSAATFTVSATGTTTQPTGTVQFLDGSANLISGTLVPVAGTKVSTLSASVSTLQVGTHSITAAYLGDPANLGNVSNVVTETITKVGTSLMLSTLNGDTAFSAPVTLTAAATSNTGGIPTGSITFKDTSTGGAIVGTASLNAAGSASLTLSSLSVGTHSIVANYAGDGNDFASSSNSVSQQIEAITTVTTLASASATADAGAAVVFTATVSPALTPPSAPLNGTVTFRDGGNILGGAVTLSGNTATYTTSTLTVGTHTITATYNGATDYGSSTSVAYVQQVVLATTTATLTAAPLPAVAGKTLVLTGKIASTGAVPSGQVTFKDGTTYIGTGTLDATGVASVSNNTFAAGAHVLTVSFGGDAQNLSATSTLSLNVSQATTSTVLSSSGTPSVVGLPVTLRAAVSGNGATPAGAVTFYQASTALGVGTLDGSGNTSLVVNFAEVGGYTISAVYAGDTNDLTSTSQPFTQQVQKTTTTTTLTSSALTAQQGSSVQFAAQVSSNAATPGGVVLFYDGTTLIGSATLNAAGLAVFNYSSLIPGQHNITAVFPGDSNNGTSTSAGLPQVIQPVTSVGLNADRNPASAGATITFTAGVSGAGVVPTGLITFYDGTAILGSAHLNAAGVGSIAVSNLPIGVHAVKATYAGDANNSAGASSVLPVTVNQATTQTLLTLPGSTVSVNASLTLVASVSGTGTVPAGSVTFYDGSSPLGTVALSQTGIASFSVASLAIGSHRIKAVYLGDTNDAASSSDAETLTVQKGTVTLQISANISPSLGGQPVTFTAILLANQGTPTGTVTWYDGSTVLSTTQVSAAEISSLTISTLIPGVHTITAVYSGDTNFSTAASNAVAETVNLGTSQTMLSGSTSSVAGESVTFAVIVSGTGAQPGGSVVLKSDGSALGTITLDAAGAGTFTTSSLSAGAHTITAAYGGDGNHTGSSGGPLSITVTQASSTSVLSSGSNPSVIHATVTLYVTVTGTGVHPTGNVTFSYGANTLGVATLDAAGQASLTVSSFSVGTHTLLATYGGDTTHGSSTSATLSQVVTQAGTTTNLTSSRNPAAVGDSIDFTVAVAGAGHPVGGTVSVHDGASIVASGTLSSNGVIVFSISTLSSGSHTLTAAYAGDINSVASTSAALIEQVQQTATTTTLIANTTDAFLHDPVTLSVAVSGLGGAPGLTATILDGTTPIATVPLNSSGLGSYVTTSLGLNSHSLSASFAGTAKFLPSTSTAVVVTVQQAGTAVTLASSKNPAIVGDAVLFSVSVTGSGNQPAGAVVISDGTAILQTLTLSDGTASFSTSSLPAGIHALVAQYGGDTTHNAARSQPLAQVVSQAMSTVALLADKQQSLTGDTVTFTVAVTSAYGRPDGTVALFDGSTPLTTVQLDATGRGSFATAALLAGQHNVVAQYVGDAAHLPAQSSAFTVTVQEVTGLTLTSSNSLATVGDTLTFSLALTGISSQSAPVVTLLDGATPIGRVALDSNGQGTLVTAALTPGAHTLSASFAGDATHEPALSANLLQVVQPANSMVTLDSSKNPASTGDSINLTVAVAGAGGSPGGIATIFDGSTSLGTAVLGSNGVGSFTTSTLAAGTHSLTAHYAGDQNHVAAISAVLSQIVLQPTFTNVVSNNNPALGGGSVTFTASVASLAGAPALPLTGTVTFNDGAVMLASLPVSGTGSATFTTSTLAAGDHSITAAYSGDKVNGSSASFAIVQTVQTVNTFTSLAASTDHLVYATGIGGSKGSTSPVTLTATVANNGNSPTGMVQFLDGSTLLGTATVGAGGVATLSVTSLTPGVHILLAIYKGDANHLTSTSNPLSLPVLQNTVVTLTPSSNPVFAQDAFTLLVAVTNGNAGVPPTGTVTVRAGSSVLGTAMLSSSGTASIPVLGLSAGLHTLVAAYDGDGEDTNSLSQPLALQVNLYPDTNRLIVSTPTLLHGQSATLTATVQGNAAVQPSGTVVFTSGGKTLGTAALNASGVASLTLTPDSGTYSITAVYAGDTLYTGSTSAPAPLTVTERPTFTVTLDPNTMSLSSKQHATIHVVLTSANGFADNLSLGCVGLPQAATCTFSTDHQALASGDTQTLTLTIDTGSPLIAGGAATQAWNQTGTSRLKVCMLPFGCVLSLLLYRRRGHLRWAESLVAALLLLASVGLTGCGNLDVNGTPAGAYSFSVTAIGSNTAVTQSAPMALTVTR